jgi:hypothetical protein
VVVDVVLEDVGAVVGDAVVTVVVMSSVAGLSVVTP